MTPDLLLLGLRFLRFALAMLIFGGGLYVIWIPPPTARSRLQAHLSTIMPVPVVALTLVTTLRLPLFAASFADGWPDALRPEVLAAVLQTSTGTAWIVDAALCAALVLSLSAGRVRLHLMALLAGLMLASSALTGHAAIGPGAWSIVHQISDAAHLLAAGFWIGSLPLLALTLRTEGAGPGALLAVQRFAVAGEAAVAIILATGTTNAVLIKGGTPLRWSSSYDALLLAKIAVVLGMVGLACLNHFALLPRLAAGSNRAAHTMRRAVLVELGLGATAIGLVTVFGMLDTA